MVCTVTGNIKDIGFQPEVSAIVRFTPLKRSAFREGNSMVVPSFLEATTDASGDFTIDLVPEGYRVEIYTDDSAGSAPLTITVPDAATAIFAQIVDLPLPDDLNAAEQAVVDAEAARDAVAASATAASTSESNAAASASAAATSEGSAATSATNAATSESNAATSASNAASSASAASTSATNAANSASAASTSETNAATSESKAQDWAENAEDIEVETGLYSAKHHAAKASDSATASSGSASAASTSATNAATSEGNAATSAGNAATSESNAATSATAAGNAQTAAEAARDQSQAAEASAQSAASSANSDAATATQAKQAAETARDDAQEVAYGADPVFNSVRVTGTAEIPGLPELSGGLGTLAAAFGQVERDHDQRIGALGASAQVTSAMISLFAALGQVSGQVNGGRAELTGGSLSDPALRIGSVGIYSSAADTLSVAIAGTEVARFTSAGLTVYGTVTEA